MHNLYTINELSDRTIVIVDVGPVPAKARALGFLTRLSEILRRHPDIRSSSLTMIDTVVQEIEKRVTNKWGYALVSYVPFTNANAVSRLFAEVKGELAKRQKANLNAVEEDEPDQFFAPRHADAQREKANLSSDREDSTESCFQPRHRAESSD